MCEFKLSHPNFLQLEAAKQACQTRFRQVRPPVCLLGTRMVVPVQQAVAIFQSLVLRFARWQNCLQVYH